MLADERRGAIAERIRTHGRVVVQEIADEFKVTAETVRRDLDVLEQAGSVRRVHGGAVSPDAHSLREPSVVERATTNAHAKQRIARLAVTRLLASATQSVLLDAGTTTGALADSLVAALGAVAGSSAAAPKLLISTHSPSIAQSLAAHPDIEVHAIGGRVRSVTGAAVGAQTVLAITALRPDLVILATNGLTSAGLSTPDPEEAAVKQALVASGRRIAVVADASKLGSESFCRFATLDQLDVLITDEQPPADLAAALADAGCEVVVA